ncbi:MAG: hypothetical protein ACHBN1_33150 [Heteroscytonema crispum UTEX LB 1556]
MSDQPSQTPNQISEEGSTVTSDGGYQTPLDENIRKTGVAAQTDAKPTAAPESTSSDTSVAGAPNQGTEKR